MYRWAEHTGELELAIDAPTERQVFADGLEALHELLSEPDAPADIDSTRVIEAEAPDRPALFAQWLEELLFLAETDGFVAGSLGSLELRGHHLRSVVGGSLGTPPPLVKAVTYHRLAFEPSGAGYVARVILDV